MADHDDEYWNARINEAAERAVGLYKEDLDDKFQQVFQATDFIKEELAKKPDRFELDEIRDDITTIKLAIKETNSDLRDLRNSTDRRLTRLEATI